MLEIVVREEENLDSSIEKLEKKLQEIYDIKEYAREAIQRLNYN